MWVTLRTKPGFWPRRRVDAPPAIPSITPAAHSHFLPAPGTGISFQRKAWHTGARGHADLVPAQSQDAAGAYAGGRGRRTSCPMYLPASADAAREISHLKITRRHKYFADSMGSRWLKSVGLLT